MADKKEKKEITLKQAKMRRLICRLAFFLIAFVTPVLITGFRFHLFTQYSHVKISVMGILIIMIIAWRFKNKLMEWVNSWENSNILKHIIIGISRVWPFLLIVAVLGIITWSASQIIKDVLFCLEWTCACELLSYIVIYPIEMKMDYHVQRLIRKNERKEDYKEVINEMSQEEKTTEETGE